MSKDSGNRDAKEMRPDDVSGRYWSSPPCKVRVDDGSRVTWIDLKRPYALIGSHKCCTLRIRGAHVPEVAYFACCLRDRVEIWPVAAIAFPRWGAIRSDLPVVVGPCSMTFHLAGEKAGGASLPFLADSEIETRISSPGQAFSKVFRRPVTIIGDDHPSVLRLHGRGMGCCQYAAVVQDQSLWLVDLSAKRMQRSERVRRFHQSGDKLLMGDATLELIAAKPLIPQVDSGEDSGIGLGSDPASGDLDSDSDIHSHGDLHSDDGASGRSAMSSGIHSYHPDPSASFIGADPLREPSPSSEPSTSPVSDDAPPFQNRETADQDRGDLGDDEDPKLCLTEGKTRKSRAIGDADDDGLVESSVADTDEFDSLILRVDGAERGLKAPKHSTGPIESSDETDESSTDAALSLVDTALGLVDAAVHESDSEEATTHSSSSTTTEVSPTDSLPSAIDDDEEDLANHCLEPEPNSRERNPFEASDVSLTGHDPPMLVDRCDVNQPSTEDPTTVGSQDALQGGTLPSEVPDQSREENANLSVASLGPTMPTTQGDEELDQVTVPSSPDLQLGNDREEPTSLNDTFEHVDQQEINQMTHHESPADHSSKALASSSSVDVPLGTEQPPSQIESEPKPVPDAKPVAASQPKHARPVHATHSKPRGQVDPEALTSHVTSRLQEIGKSRSLLQQLIRWFAITAGIIVPTTVVVWVVHRIYTDWF